MGVMFATPDKGDAIVAVARNVERAVEAEAGLAEDGAEAGAEAGAEVSTADATGASSQVDAVPSGPDQHGDEPDQQDEGDGGTQ